MKVLVIGRSGQIARSLLDVASRRSEIEVDALARPELDIVKPDTIDRAIEKARPDIVINAAAFTAVDKAEDEPETAFAVNRDGAGAVAKASARYDIPLIHLSTDYVFDGRKQSPYLESDPVGPINIYGRSKLEGELAVRQENPRHVILRTAWVYAPFGSNFLKTMLRLASERDSVRVVDDQKGCPSYALDIADAILSIAGQLKRGPWTAGHFGITHLAGPEGISWCDFARVIMASAAANGMPSARIDPITTAQYPTRAARPADSRLDTARLADLFAIRLPPLQKSVGDCLRRLRADRC